LVALYAVTATTFTFGENSALSGFGKFRLTLPPLAAAAGGRDWCEWLDGLGKLFSGLSTRSAIVEGDREARSADHILLPVGASHCNAAP
jgi:hypothetical protein